MAIVTGDRYLERLVKFVEEQAGPLIEGSIVLKLNPAGLHYVQSRLEALQELEQLLAGAPVDYLRAYVSDLGDHRALEQLRRILRLLTAVKVVSTLPPPARDPTPLSFLPFVRLKFLELRGCDLSTSAAKGLLELRHTLEKIICHNSTDALRHIFASRISEIKDCPQWNRLSFVSCACNRLVLMDESLQLLPAVETLDLSRNKFAKVDNLRKCCKLKHLDLGFNNLRTIAAFGEVSCYIIKLVLRNNALTTLRGIENLKLLEDFDVSYNVISNFSELEFLARLPNLQSLWLEGNPLCCSRWYRAQVFSYFTHPDKLKLDDNEISTREIWQRQIIIASRQKRPASFGFYSPVKDDAEGDDNYNRKKKKVSRLASIQIEEESTYIGSDQDSGSYDKEIQQGEENVISDDDSEVVDLMNRVEHMKRERSVLWLREFKEWMDHASDNYMDDSITSGAKVHSGCGNYVNNKKSKRHVAESSRYGSDSVQASGDESSTNIIESEDLIADMPSGWNRFQCFDCIGSLGITGGVCLPGMERMVSGQERHKPYSREKLVNASVQAKSSCPETYNRMVENVKESSLMSIDDVSDAHLSSTSPGSPPHYKEDILHRRHNLVEEILQLSAESYSLASSDSDTSCSNDDCSSHEYSMPQVDQALNHEYAYRTNDEHSFSGIVEDTDYHRTCKGACEIDNVRSINAISSAHDGESAFSVHQNAFRLEKKKKRKKKRVISLLEQSVNAETETSQKLNSCFDTSDADFEIEQGNQSFDGSALQNDIDMNQTEEISITTHSVNNNGRFSIVNSPLLGEEDFIEHYFNKNIADSQSHETCRQYSFCCMLELESSYREREVAVLCSSRNKLYVLLLGVASDGSGKMLSLLGCHNVEDVREVFVGLGLQVVRLSTKSDQTYLFITRSFEKSWQLLSILHVLDSYLSNAQFSLRSLEQVQVKLFEQQVCGGSNVSIFQYCMVLFWHSESKVGSWLERSLFLVEGHILLCCEDLRQFNFALDGASCLPYYSLDSCCMVNNVSEMVVEFSENLCVTLTVDSATPEFCSSAESCNKERTSSGSLTWKLKWFSEKSLLNFVALWKAMHAEKASSPLLVRYLS